VSENPYRCTVDVRGDGRYCEVWVAIERPNWAWCFEEFLIGFDAEAEANEQADLILQALKGATRE
jgi:hypothetical protein